LLDVQVNPVTDWPAAPSAWRVRVSPTDMLQKTRLSRLPEATSRDGHRNTKLLAYSSVESRYW